MIFKYKKTYPTDTLDVHNFNEPFSRASIIIENIYEKAVKLKESVEKLHIFTDKDKITLISNGIKERFSVDENKKELNIFQETTLKFSYFFKKNSGARTAEDESPLNLSELVEEMHIAGYLKKEAIYETKLLKQDYRNSNLKSMDELHQELFLNTGNIELLELSNTNSSIEENSLLNIAESENLLLHKEKEHQQVTLVEVAPGELILKSATFDKISFSEDALFENERENISLGKAREMSVPLSVEIGHELYINNPTLQAPINKTSFSNIISNFVSKKMKLFTSLAVTRKNSTSKLVEESDQIVTERESLAIIDEMFKSLVSPNIDNIADYESLVKDICVSPEQDYVLSDFSIEGGKIYVGFDYSSMHSVFNSESFKKILLERTGKVDSSTEATFKASNYFVEIQSFQEFYSIANNLGYEINLEKDSLADVFAIIKSVVLDLCAMNLAPLLAEPLVPPSPVVKNYVFLNPQLISFSAKYNRPYLTLPHFYIQQEALILNRYRTFCASNPSFIEVPQIEIPLYIPEVNALNLMAIRRPNCEDVEEVYSPRIQGPEGGGKAKIELFSQEDVRLHLFYDSEECDKRVRATTSRTVNMIDAYVLCQKIVNSIEGNKFNLLTEEGFHLSPTKSIVFTVSEIMCYLAKILPETIGMNVRTEELFQEAVNKDEDEDEEGEDSAEDNSMIFVRCRGEKSSAFDSRKIQLVIDDALVFDDEVGSVSDTEYKFSELWMLSEVSLSGLGNWQSISSVKYKESIAKVATRMSTQITKYFKELDITPLMEGKTGKSLKIRGKKKIVSSIGNDIIMYEYLSFTNAPLDWTKEIGTPDGIFDGIDENEIPTIEELREKHGYGVVNVASNKPVSVFPVDANKKRPLIPRGDHRLVFFYPDSVSGERLDSMSYASVDKNISLPVAVTDPVAIIMFTKKEKPVDVFFFRCSVSVVSKRESIRVKRRDQHLYRNFNSLYIEITSDTPEAEKAVIYAGEKHTIGQVAPLGTVSCLDPRVPIVTIDLAQSGETASANKGTTIFGRRDRGDRDREENEISTTISLVKSEDDDAGGCSRRCGDGEKPTSSGIDPSLFENIASLRHLDPGTPASWKIEGETPGNLSFTLQATVSSYAEGSTNKTAGIGTLKDDVLSIPISMGTIDGLSDENGDVLARGSAPGLIESGELKVYVRGHCHSIQIEDRVDFTVFAIDLAALPTLFESVSYIGDLTTESLPLNEVTVVNGRYSSIEKLPISVQLGGGKPIPNETLVHSIRFSGSQFSFKYDGSNPHWPISTAASGFQQVAVTNESTFMSSMANPSPRLLLDEEYEPGEQEFSGIKLENGVLKYFIRKSKSFDGLSTIIVREEEIDDCDGLPPDPEPEAEDLTESPEGPVVKYFDFDTDGYLRGQDITW